MALESKNPRPLSCENPCFEIESFGAGVGTTFYFPSRRRFIPYSWLLFSELNNDATELNFHYTHSIVTITGSRLRPVQEAVERFVLRWVRERSQSFSGENPGATVTRIEIAENVAT